MSEELKKYYKLKEQEEFRHKFAPFKREAISLLLLDIKSKGAVSREFAEAHIECLLGTGEDYPPKLIKKLIEAELVEEKADTLFLTSKGQVIASIFEKKLKKKLESLSR